MRKQRVHLTDRIFTLFFSQEIPGCERKMLSRIALRRTGKKPPEDPNPGGESSAAGSFALDLLFYLQTVQ